jgi:hypothetical protein
MRTRKDPKNDDDLRDDLSLVDDAAFEAAPLAECAFIVDALHRRTTSNSADR